MNYAEKRAALQAELADKLAKLDLEEQMNGELAAAGITPNFVFAHKGYTHARLLNDMKPVTVAEALAMLAPLADRIVPFESATDGLFRSIRPRELLGAKYDKSDGEFMFELRQQLYGESAEQRAATYYRASITAWVRLNDGSLAEIVVPVSGLPRDYVVRNRGDSYEVVKPWIPGARQVIFAPGSRNGADVRYLLASQEDVATALVKAVAA